MRDISSPLDGFSSPFGPQRNRTLQSLLFGQTEPGFTFEPWDIATLYQDRAGTTPVTAAGQSVGLRLDKSKQTYFEPRRNFLTYTEQFDNAAWTKSGGVVSADADGTYDRFTPASATANANIAVVTGIFVLGTNTVSVDFKASGVSWGRIRIATGTVGGVVSTGNRPAFSFANFDLVNGTVGTIGSGGGTSSITSLGNGYYRCTYNFSCTSAGTLVVQFMALQSDSTADFPSFTWTGTDSLLLGRGQAETTSTAYQATAALPVSWLGNHEVAISDAKRGIYGWMPKTGRRNKLNATETLSTQFVTVTAVAHTLAFTGTGTVVLSGAYVGTLIGTGASDRVTLTFTPLAASLTLTVTGSVTLAQLQLGSVDTAYQRVNSQYDVTEAGVPTCYYVQADGVDDAYVTPTITPNTDKVQVFAGVRKLLDAPQGVVIETGTSTGVFGLSAPRTGNGRKDFGFFSIGTVFSGATSGDVYAAPFSAVLTSLGDISGDTATLRVNGTQAAQSTSDQGTGNYLAYPAYIYSRGGTSLPFNGLDFGHAVRFGPNLDAATIALVEALIARNTPEVTL